MKRFIIGIILALAAVLLVPAPAQAYEQEDCNGYTVVSMCLKVNYRDQFDGTGLVVTRIEISGRHCGGFESSGNAYFTHHLRGYGNSGEIWFYRGQFGTTKAENCDDVFTQDFTIPSQRGEINWVYTARINAWPDADVDTLNTELCKSNGEC